MAKSIIFFLFLIPIGIGKIYAQENNIIYPTFENSFSDYVGWLGDERIGLYIGPAGGSKLAGHFFHFSNLRDLPLRGEIIDSAHILLYATDSNGKTNGVFRLHYVGFICDSLFGIYVSTSGQTSTVTLSFAHNVLGPSVALDRYGNSKPSEKAIENNIQTLYFAIIAHDSQKVADNIHYPITASFQNRRSITIRNKKQLLRNYTKIFNPFMVNKLKEYAPHDLEMYNNGIKLGEAEICFDFDGKAQSINVVSETIKE
jgi:hypothetical protein